MRMDHLLLLIGANPLPNYVVAEYFLRLKPKPRSITAVCSQATCEIAERLQKVLNRRHQGLKYHYLQLSDPGNAAKIQNEFAAQLKIVKDETYHLNYTGGTKSMVVQSYLSLLEKFSADEKHHATFSYLDARDFKLKSDDGRLMSDDLRKTTEGFREYFKCDGYFTKRWIGRKYLPGLWASLLLY